MNYLKHSYLIILLGLLVGACGEYKLEEELDETDEDIPHTVKVVTRSDNNAPIHYPLTVYLFNEEGKCVQQDLIADESVSYSSNVPEGKYTIVLLSGITDNEYFMPLDIATDSYISIKESNYSKEPIQIAQSQINLTKSTTVQMTLSYAVASINFVINDVPKEATNVSIDISPVSSGIAFDGEYKNDKQSCSIPCAEENGQWMSETVYILPSESQSTHLSVQIEMPDGNKTYGYTYQSPLLPGYPYQFTGNYKDGITLNGEFQAEGWQPIVDVEFGLSETIPDSPSGEEENPDSTEEPNPGPITGDGTETFYVNELPEAESIWEGCFVWKVTEISSTECEAVLIAPDQWESLAANGMEIINEYEYNGITSWRTFTRDEGKEIYKQYSQSLEDLNAFLRENGLAEFSNAEGRRYLCENCQKTFAFYNNMITSAGRTVIYFLRPVKTVRLKL